MRVLVLDNDDSFTWNLVHSLQIAGGQCTVFRSDRCSLTDVHRQQPERIVFSPGPYGPDHTGICRSVLAEYAEQVPILGVCLGMQVIAEAEGARVVPSGKPMHGKASMVRHDKSRLFKGVPNPFGAARYHSLIVEPHSMPPHIQRSAWAEDGTVLGFRVQGKRIEGVMFHPESFLTDFGSQIIANFLRD